MNITVTINIPAIEELSRTIHVYASAIAFNGKKQDGDKSITPAKAVAELDNNQVINSTPVQQPIQTPTMQPIYQAPAVPVQQPVQQYTQPSVQTQTPTQAQSVSVPTAAQTYTMEQLAVAATQLTDAGRRNEIIGLLQQFGVQALTALPKEQYGAFATQLRAMGAKI